MAGPKTNEREGIRAVLRHAHISPYKVREVLDLVRGRPVHEAEDILRFAERDAALTVGKLLRSAVANAEHNEELDPEELFVSACFADEGTTVKRWRPRARGRATRIRKRTSHITVIVSRLPEDRLRRLQDRRQAEQLAQRARRVAGARKASGDIRSRAARRGNLVLEPERPEAASPERPAEATSAAEVAAIEEEQGIVDQTAPVVAASEAAADDVGGASQETGGETASEAAAPPTDKKDDT